VTDTRGFAETQNVTSHRTKRWAASAAIAVSLITASASAQPSAAWVLGYENQSTNQFEHDPRTATLVKVTLPATLAPLVLEALDGPPDPVFVRDRRYVSASACRAHACPSKGFFWIDTQTGVGVGARLEAWPSVGPAISATTLLIGSNGVSATTLPSAAQDAIAAWIADTGIAGADVVRFIGSDDVAVPFALRIQAARYQPPTGGPSFDCATAASAIERAICGDWEVSGLDLQLFEAYERERLGLDTVPAREQLRTLQRDWLKARDTDCAPSADIIACVRRYYRQQIDVLLRWTPSR
jgi:uncharacterized protein YecT (DUF1311 family)